MKLTSPAFENNGKIPSKYTCDGVGISPPLKISDVPANAKTLVLLMEDPDIPEVVKQRFRIQIWDHWILFNLPATTKEIPEGKSVGTKGKGTYPHLNYGGPCPPDKEHRYFFKLYALDAKLDLLEGATKVQVEKAMHSHILARIELIGRYERIR